MTSFCLVWSLTKIFLEVIDKMASFVASSGRQFEQKVWESESNNPKFGFIQPTHHYHAYYLQQLKQPQGNWEKV